MRKSGILALILIATGFAGSVLSQSAPTSKFPRAFVGTITDQNDNPIEGARVEFGYFNAQPNQREFTTTDATGSYRLEVNKAGNDYRLGVSASGFAPTYRTNWLPGPLDTPKTFSTKLHPGGTIQLKLVTKSGQPAAGLKVRPMTASYGSHSSFSHPVPATNFPGADRTVTANSEGLVTLDSLPPLPEYQEPKEEAKTIRTRAAPRWIELQVFYSSGAYYELPISLAAQTKDGQPIAITVRDHVMRNKDSTPTIIKGRVVDKDSGEAVTDYVVVRRYRTKIWPFTSPAFGPKLRVQSQALSFQRHRQPQAGDTIGKSAARTASPSRAANRSPIQAKPQVRATFGGAKDDYLATIAI